MGSGQALRPAQDKPFDPLRTGLGNVLAVVSDHKRPLDTDGLTDAYEADSYHVLVTLPELLLP